LSLGHLSGFPKTVPLPISAVGATNEYNIPGRAVMKHVIQIAPEDDARAWGILVRHSPGIALPNRIVIVSDEAVRTLREAGVRFDEFDTSKK
jgi:hypothetical protein